MRNAATSWCLIAGLGLSVTLSGLASAADNAGTSPAPAAPASAKAMERMQLLKGAIKSFQLHLSYGGPLANHYYSLNIVEGDTRAMSASAYNPWTMEPEPRLIAIIDHLAASGFLDHAEEVKEAQPKSGPENHYTLEVSVETAPGKKLRWQEDLGWGQPLLRRIEALRPLVDGSSGWVMDRMINVLRKELATPAADQPK